MWLLENFKLHMYNSSYFISTEQCFIFATHRAVLGQAASASSGNLLETKTLMPHPRPTESEFAFLENLMRFVCMLKFE